MRILVIYLYCTFGGVERVLLNRIEALRNHGFDFKMDAVFLHDSGGFESFQRYIKTYNLSEFISVYHFDGDLAAQFSVRGYDFIFSIDTPTVFGQFAGMNNFFVECHTPYRENRLYLKALPENVHSIIVPSAAFLKEIRNEIPASKDVFVIPNPVPRIFFGGQSASHGRGKAKRPLVYMARLDSLKNVDEAVEIFKALEDREDLQFIIIGRGAGEESLIRKLKIAGLRDRCLLKESIQLEEVPEFLNLIGAQKGIFLSPSKGESFGMAVAECIASGVPVMVSDIPAHRELLSSDDSFLYRLGNIDDAAGKIACLLDEWEHASETIMKYREPLREHNFISAWTKFILKQQSAISKHVILEKEKEISRLREENSGLKTQKKKIIREFEHYKNDKEPYIARLRKREDELLAVKQSLTWKLGQLYGKYVFNRKINTVIEKLLSRLIGSRLRDLPLDSHPVSARYSPYERLAFLKNIAVMEVQKSDLAPVPVNNAFSLITTVKNERHSVEAFLTSVENQTLPPAALIIVDGGSTDGTQERIKTFMDSTKLNINLIEQSVNIAEGRNLAIDNSPHEIILVTDAGCRLESDWCETIARAFHLYDDVDVVAGIYESLNNSRSFVWDWDSMNFQKFLPSSRNIAFRKDVFNKAGGYPEWLTLTGEDTLFDIHIRRVSRKWLIIKDLVIYWSAPSTRQQVMKTAFNYNVGDGESGFGLFRYYKDFAAYAKSGKLDFPDPLAKTGFEGFLQGFRRRIPKLKDHLKGNVLIFSGVPIYDSGGAQRGAQLALEFVRSGYFVTYINVYPSFEKNEKIFMDVDISRIELWQIDDFDTDIYQERFRDVLKGTIILLEFPHPLFIAIVRKLKERDPSVVVMYDCIDNWDSALGWEWYSPEVEKQIVSHSDVLVASANTLQERVRRLSGWDTFLIPNAVNLNLFGKTDFLQRPQDLPEAEPVIMYVGSLWGQWFDWGLLAEISEAYSDAAIVCIGDYKGECPYRLHNVHFLGLKPHHKIPEYLKYADVCIIPFKVDGITEAVNPLKVYEYLAMGKPVVTTHMNEVKGMPNVYVSGDNSEFISNIGAALSNRFDEESTQDFLMKNSWNQRVNMILQAAGSGVKPS